MSEEFVTVATYQFLPEAEAHKLRLEGEGFTVFLADTEMIGMNVFLGNAIGYIKLQVPSSQVDAATALIEKIREQGKLRDEQTDDVDVCLSCGAKLPEEAIECPACGFSYGHSENE